MQSIPLKILKEKTFKQHTNKNSEDKFPWTLPLYKSLTFYNADAEHIEILNLPLLTIVGFYNFVFILLFICSGYLITCPRLFRAGSTQELSVSLIDVNETWFIHASLTYRSGPGEEIASDGAQFTSDSEGTLKLNVSVSKVQDILGKSAIFFSHQNNSTNLFLL